MYHQLSSLISKKRTQFNGLMLSVSDDKGHLLKKPIKVSSNGRKNNFGPILNDLPKLFPHIYSLDDADPSDILITNNNRENFLAWYLDGSDNFTIKKNLPSCSSYAISETQFFSDGLWISKPSHPYIGSGSLIKIGKKKDLAKRKTERYKTYEVSSWVLQPLISDIILWQGTKKFDIRFHSIFYTFEGKINVLMYNYGMGRKCVEDYDPVRNYETAITNISFQRNVYGYDEELHIFLVNDDIGCQKMVMEDLLAKSKDLLKIDPRKQHQILFVGLDVMISLSGMPILIEVNSSPTLEVYEKNNLGLFAQGTLLGLFGYLIPALSEGRDVNMKDLKDWDKISMASN